MYEKVSSNFDFVTREKAVLDFWKKNGMFKNEKLTIGKEEAPW